MYTVVDHVSVLAPTPSRSVFRKLWLTAICAAAVISLFFFTYVYIADGRLDLAGVSVGIAATAAVMIGCSFALSSICYFFNFLDWAIVYRKYFGLVGYYLALIYSFMLLAVDPERYFYGFFENIGSADFILGLTAMVIFTFMALISNDRGIRVLGPQRWRKALRLGYFAYALLVERAYVLEHGAWRAWITRPTDSLPPVRLVISVFAVSVIGLRILMLVAKWRKGKH